MNTRRFRLVVLLVLFCGATCAHALASGTTVDVTASPSAVSRGEYLTYTAVVTNGSTAADLILQDNLPTGLDQWNGQYRVDGGAWHTLPPTGWIPLGTLNSGGSATVDIKARVEYGAPGTLSNTVHVTNGTVDLTSSTVLVNVLPLVDAGPDKMVPLGSSLAIADSSASDGGDGIASYAWDDGGGGGSFDNSGIIHPVYTSAATSGLVKLTLTATDLDGGVVSDSFWLRINAYPTVNAGADKTVDEEREIFLSDAMAADSDGWVVSCSWTDNGLGGSFDDAYSLHPTYTAPSVDGCEGSDVTLTFTATDDWGAEASDDLQVRVENVNHTPQVAAGIDQHATPGDSVALQATASDPDGPIADTHWEQIAGQSVTLSDTTGLQVEFIAPDAVSETFLSFRISVTDACGDTASDEVSVTIAPAHAAAAAIAIAKDVDRNSASLGDTLTYTYKVTNSGNVPLVDVVVTDDMLEAIDLSNNDLVAGETTTGMASMTVTEDLFPGPIINTATVTAQTTDGQQVSDNATASVVLHVEPGAIKIELAAQDGRGFPISPFDSLAIGETITYAYTITNTGDSPLSNLALKDIRIGSIRLSRTNLASWGSLTGSFTLTIEEEDLLGPFSDTVTVTAVDMSGATIAASDSLTLFGIASSVDLDLVKECNASRAVVGDTVTYSYTITNSGDTTVIGLSLRDDRIGSIALPKSVLTPGETIVASAEYAVKSGDAPGPLTNTASVTGNDLVGQEVNAGATLSIDVEEPAPAGGGGSVSPSLDGKVIINEIAWGGTPASPADEWIELRNLGSIPVDLDGWSICWYAKGGSVPEQDQWARVPLTGVIAPSPIDLSIPRVPGSQIAFGADGEYTWRVIDMSWWSAGKKGTNGRSYYVLERRYDKTLSDVSADLVYDPRVTAKYILPDSGAAVLLVDSTGTVVDTANAEHATLSGWPAGNRDSCATMERTDPMQGDFDANWHTNPGILVYGRDAAGDRLSATAGKPNSPTIDELMTLAQDQSTLVRAPAQVDVSLARGEKPQVRVAALDINVAGGGGGTNSGSTLSTHYDGTDSSLNIDTSSLAPGTYYVWITNGEGEAILVPLAVPVPQ